MQIFAWSRHCAASGCFIRAENKAATLPRPAETAWAGLSSTPRAQDCSTARADDRFGSSACGKCPCSPARRHHEPVRGPKTRPRNAGLVDVARLGFVRGIEKSRQDRQGLAERMLDARAIGRTPGERVQSPSCIRVDRLNRFGESGFDHGFPVPIARRHKMPRLLAHQAPNWLVRLVGVNASRLALVFGRRLKSRHRCRVGVVHGCDQCSAESSHQSVSDRVGMARPPQLSTFGMRAAYCALRARTRNACSRRPCQRSNSSPRSSSWIASRSRSEKRSCANSPSRIWRAREP